MVGLISLEEFADWFFCMVQCLDRSRYQPVKAASHLHIPTNRQKICFFFFFSNVTADATNSEGSEFTTWLPKNGGCWPCRYRGSPGSTRVKPPSHPRTFPPPCDLIPAQPCLALTSLLLCVWQKGREVNKHLGGGGGGGKEGAAWNYLLADAHLSKLV